jgi:hypothetical protein
VAAAEPRILRPGQDDPRAAPGTLLPGEVEVWLFELSAERADRLATALAPDELEHRDRLRQPDARVRFADVRGCLRTILAGHLGVQPGEIAFRSGPHGKPALAERHGSDLEFSVSHSASLAAIAVAAAFLASIFTPWAAVWGSALIAVAVIGWFWPKGTKEDEE